MRSVDDAELPLLVRHTPFIAKQPLPMLKPPPEVEVAVVARLSAPAMVVEAPTKRLPVMVRAVVEAPPLNNWRADHELRSLRSVDDAELPLEVRHVPLTEKQPD